MKKLLLITLLLVVHAGVRSQSLLLVFKNKELGINAVIGSDSIDPKLGFIKVPIVVKNLKETAVDIKVRKTEKSVLSGSENSFCWGINCYSGTVTDSDIPVTIPAKSSDGSFYAEYDPANKDSGKTVVEYRFYEVTDRNNYATVTVWFCEKGAKCGITILSGGEYLAVYPTGNNGMFRISYNLNERSHLVIHNLSGQITGEYNLFPGMGLKTLAVKSYHSVAVYSLIRSGQIVQSGKIALY